MLQNFTEQVLIDFPWFDALDALWKGNPAFAPKTISSVPGIDHASNLAALTKGNSKDKQAAPPPDPSSLAGDTEIDLVIEDEVIDNTINEMLDPLLTQGKGKEKALPPPSTDEPMVEEPSPNDMDYSSHIPHAEPPIPNTAFDNADDDMGMQDWDDMGALEDDNTIQPRLSKKRPYSSPSPPPPVPSHGKFQTHADRAMNRGTIRSPKPPSSIASSSASSSRSHSRTSSTAISSSHSQSARRPAASQKSSLSKRVDTEMQDVQSQVQSLTDGMSYIYTAKAAASEYKIAKVNAHRHQRDIEFQREQAEKERDEAAAVHQRTQEAKTLELQVLEAQAKVQAEKRAALQLEIELLKLRGGATAE